MTASPQAFWFGLVATIALLVGAVSLAGAEPTLLFKSNFEKVTLNTATIDPNGKNARQAISGGDTGNGWSSWPIKALNATTSELEMVTIAEKLIPDNPSTGEKGNLQYYAVNEIVTVPGPLGGLVNALSQKVLQKGPAGTWDAQTPLMIQRPLTSTDTDFYVTYWFMHDEK